MAVRSVKDMHVRNVVQMESAEAQYMLIDLDCSVAREITCSDENQKT